ncbi:hypothetical protein T35B1_15896 [Salinisphaera shabanensis T35B1]|uniref:LysE family translocator n=1 Tax=Salinisphaera shabanensis TaxID=180542 RepID=UPI0033415290
MEIAVYTFCVMYSPGPVNLLAFNAGLRGALLVLIGYCVGVGSAMLSVFVVLGYVGAAVVKTALLPYFALAGSAYILYLAYLVFTAPADWQASGPPGVQLRFREGYGLQLLNPKGWVLVLPVTTVMFPAADITGGAILVYGLLISLGAIGAPAASALLGRFAGRRITNRRVMAAANKTMAIVLVLVACSMVYDFVIATPAIAS